MKLATISQYELSRYRKFHYRIYKRMTRLIADGEMVLVRDERRPYGV